MLKTVRGRKAVLSVSELGLGVLSPRHTQGSPTAMIVAGSISLAGARRGPGKPSNKRPQSRTRFVASASNDAGEVTEASFEVRALWAMLGRPEEAILQLSHLSARCVASKVGSAPMPACTWF